MSERLRPTNPVESAPARAIDDLAEIVQAIRQGNRQAVRTFIAAVGPAMLRAIRQVMGADYPDAEDLLQEASLNVLDALPRFSYECSILHFACRTAVLTAMNVRRRQAAAKRGWRKLSRIDLDAVQNEQACPGECLDERKAMLAVRELLTTLPEAQAEALALHCVLGCSIEEIATSLAVPKETVRSRLRLAKVALRERVLGDATLTDLVKGVS